MRIIFGVFKLLFDLFVNGVLQEVIVFFDMFLYLRGRCRHAADAFL